MHQRKLSLVKTFLYLVQEPTTIPRKVCCAMLSTNRGELVQSIALLKSPIIYKLKIQKRRRMKFQWYMPSKIKGVDHSEK